MKTLVMQEKKAKFGAEVKICRQVSRIMDTGLEKPI